MRDWIASAVRRAGGREEALIFLLLVVATGVGFTWGLPGADSWAGDAISPRSCGLGAIVETYRPGHYHTYPPLHMALLTALSLPWMALAAIRAGTGIDALGAELVKPFYMTGIEVGARLLAMAMALGTVAAVITLWRRLAGRRAGIVAGAVTVSNAVFVYYAHTGNLDLPYLFWIAWALVELDRVMAGQAREMRALLFATAAALTKDQAVAALVLPLVYALVIVPWCARRQSPLRAPLVRGAAVAAGVFLAASGAATNPAGFARRVAFLVGPASQTWAQYPKGAAGFLRLALDATASLPRFTSWPLAAAAGLGLGVAAWRVSRRRGDRCLADFRALLPLCAAVSFTCLFTVGARRTEERFVLPQVFFLLPYAGLALSPRAPWRRWMGSAAGRRASWAAFGFSVGWAALGVASLDATLLADSRYEAERFLASLPAGTHVEAYGGPIFLPRMPAGLDVVRPGLEPLSTRQGIPGLHDLVVCDLDPRPRAPAVIVLDAQLSRLEETEPPPLHPAFALAQYGDAKSHALFRGLYDGSLGYRRALTARCSLPWPLSCRKIHGSTGAEIWIYVPR